MSTYALGPFPSRASRPLDLMFGQYDGFVIVDLPDSRAAAASSLAVSSTGAFEHLETHELIEAEDVTPILEQAKGITSQLPDS